MTFYELCREVAAETLKKYPDMPSRTMARLLHTQHPEMFPSVENARTLIRTFRGTTGEYKRNQKIYMSHVR